MRASYEMLCANTGIGSRHCGIKILFPPGNKTQVDREADLMRHGDTVVKDDVLNHETLTQLSCKKAGKSLTVLKIEIEMFMMRIIMFVTAGDWI